MLARHKELSEKAKAMMEKINRTSSVDTGKSTDDEDRQTRLREQARRLLAENRTKPFSKSLNLDSPTSPIKQITHRITLSPERTISPINNLEHFQFNKINSKENSPIRTPLSDEKISGIRESSPKDIIENDKNRNSPSRKSHENSPLQSFNSILDKVSPKSDKAVSFDTNIYKKKLIKNLFKF